jgi:predicted RNase H-like HicB family nuclease
MQYAVVITQLPHNYSAYVPDLPGCVATGATFEDVQRNIREAVAIHVEAMRQDGDALPEYPSYGDTVEVPALVHA